MIDHTVCLTNWLTVAEAAAYVRTKPRTLLKWVREGSVKGYALHGTKRVTWRFRREDLDATMGFARDGVVAFSTSSVAR